MSIQNGLQLACRYSFNCQRARLFNIGDVLFAFANLAALPDEQTLRKIKELLSKLETMRFYEQLGLISGFDPFSFEVVSGYWKGLPPLGEKAVWHNGTNLLPLVDLPWAVINADLLSQCFVLGGRVLEAKKDRFLLEQGIIAKEADKLRLTLVEADAIANPFDLELAVGDYVTVHFGSVIEKITQAESEILEKLTRTSLREFCQNF